MLGVVVEPVVGVVVPELVELELAAFAIAAPPPAMIPTVPSVTRAIRSRFMAFTSFRVSVFVAVVVLTVSLVVVVAAELGRRSAERRLAL